ncbi:CHAT domain-containing protein [Brevundimonas sp.]|uniref:CHAT domain-containing protein n=1 Tax=Brevundimonas sp. TaxID=1871086 RepID=UPI0028ACCC1B|nr:CHAT domain-containing protein [Brevundimonas sp.]
MTAPDRDRVPEHTDEQTAMDEVSEITAEVDRLAEAGDLAGAFDAIDRLAGPDVVGRLLRVHVFIKARLTLQAAALLREVDAGREITGALQAIGAAQLAYRAQAFDLTGRFLRQALAAVSAPEEWGAVLEAATRLDEPEVARLTATALDRADPQSVTLGRYRLKTALDAGDFVRAANLARSLPDEVAAFYDALAGLLEAQRPDYSAILATLETDWPQHRRHALHLLSVDADRAGRPFDVFGLALDAVDNEDLTSTQVVGVISAMQGLLLAQPGDEEAVIEALDATIRLGLTRLATSPSDTAVRARLGSLVSTEESGLLGRAALHLTVMGMLDDPARIAEPPPRPIAMEAQVADWEAAIEAWGRRGGVKMLGVSSCPPDLVPKSFHAGVLWAAVCSIEGFIGRLNSDDEILAFQSYVTLVAGFAAHVQGPDRDLDIVAIKLAAELLARSNRRQAARDMIEVVLQISDADEARARAAWFAYATIHRQTGDMLEALMATCAGLLIDATITPVAAWHEAVDLVRLLRDLNEPDEALGQVSRAAILLKQMNLDAVYASRLETMRLQIEQSRVLDQRGGDPERIRRFAREATANAQAVLAAEDDANPVAMMLAQALRDLDDEAPERRPAEAALRALLAAMPAAAAERARRFGGPPSIEDLTTQATELQGARYGRNLIQDVHPLVVLARRYLDRHDLSADGAALALELLADQGLLDRADNGDEAPARLPTDPAQVLATATALSRTGLNVCLLGLNHDRRLVRLDVVDGQTPSPIIETETTFSQSRLMEWRKDFPNQYAYVVDQKNKHGQPLNGLELAAAFEQSLSSIGVSCLPEQRVVIIPDAKLSDLPFNLLPVDGATAGETRMVCTAPSLNWLAGAAARRQTPRGPSLCWVPTPGAAADQLLPRIAQDIEPILTEAGIPLSQAQTAPDGLRNAELAIVAVHGGIAGLEGRFFRGVADDAQRRLASDDLARSLAGAKVAILFVCHGARLDAAPEGQASLGLARQLLDRGCSAVIGAPWPLRGDVPARWLPHFLEAWGQDLPVADANAYANEKIGGLPDVRHALHVYGDPLVKR